MSSELIQISFDNSIFIVDENDPTLCKCFDKDCLDILAEGYTKTCASELPSVGKCPFVGE